MRLYRTDPYFDTEPDAKLSKTRSTSISILISSNYQLAYIIVIIVTRLNMIIRKLAFEVFEVQLYGVLVAVMQWPLQVLIPCWCRAINQGSCPQPYQYPYFHSDWYYQIISSNVEGCLLLTGTGCCQRPLPESSRRLGTNPHASLGVLGHPKSDDFHV